MDTDQEQNKTVSSQLILGIDMIKIMVEGLCCVYLVVVLNWYTQKMMGFYEGM
jgi:hypothetical protein